MSILKEDYKLTDGIDVLRLELMSISKMKTGVYFSNN
jgi:hypothetical protein